MTTPPEPAGTDDVAQLRRRLYQPSASDDDVDRYRSAVAAVAPSLPGAPARRPRRRRWKLAALIAAPVAVIALSRGAIVSGSAPAPTPTPVAAATVALAEQRRTPAPYSFQQVAASSEPLSLTRTVTEAGVSFAGIGPGTIPLDPATLSAHGGVIRVEMLTDTSAAVGWQMDRIATRADFSSYDQPLARGRARQEMAPVTPVRVEYVGVPPTTIRVQAPIGTRWWLDLHLAQRSG